MRTSRIMIKEFIKSNLPFLSNFINLGFIQVCNAVIQILLFPIIFHIIGIKEFGYVGVANSYAGLVSLLINYGTNQSGIKDIAINKQNKNQLSNIFYSVYYTRILLFLISLIALGVLYYIQVPLLHYFILANVIIVAEVFNPFFFFVGMEKLFIFNVANLLSKVSSGLLIIFFVTSSSSGSFVNLYLGSGNLVFYLLLTFYAINRYGLSQYAIHSSDIKGLLCKNFFLAGNNLSVQLQQSFFVFTLSGSVNPLVLGAYTFCDKIVWSFRLILIAFSSAVYPRAAITYHLKKEDWFLQKRRLNLILIIVFLTAAAALFFLAPSVVLLLTKTTDALTIHYIRCISLVPLISALNALNVIELLIGNSYSSLFKMGLALMVLTSVNSFLFLRAGVGYFGYYPITMEICGLLMCLYFTKKQQNQLS